MKPSQKQTDMFLSLRHCEIWKPICLFDGSFYIQINF